jgi:hypothetical protein
VHLDRQSAIAVASGNHRGHVQLRPAVATLAVGRQLMLVAVEAGVGAEVNHGGISAPGRDQHVTRITSNSAFPDELLRRMGAECGDAWS